MRIIRNISIGTVIGILIAFFALVPEIKRCPIGQQFGTDILCPYPTQTSIPTRKPALTATPIVPGMVLLDENFERNEQLRVTVGGNLTPWRVKLDEKGNKVYEIDNRIAISTMGGPSFDFGFWYWGDYAITYRFRILEDAENTFASVAFRMQDPGQNQCCNAYIVNFTANRLALLIADSTPDWVLIKAKDFDLVNNHWYQIRIQAHGKTIEVFVDGQLYLAVSDTRFDKGAISWSVDVGDFVQFDDIRVTAIKSD
jgi:hypothetical protein